MRGILTLVVPLGLAALVMPACSRGPGSSPPRSSEETFVVDVRTETFVDSARGSTLETTIWVPSGRARPLIVFAHGSGGNPDFYRVLLEAWATKGYVVAAPRMSSDRLGQPADMSFLITELLRLSAAPSGPFAGLVDADRIGVAGHSAGGVAALGVAFNTCCVDRRIRAGVVLAGDAPPVPGGTYFTGIRTPLLVVHGLADPTVPFAEGRRIFTEALAPKLMLTVPASDVPSADHARPYVGTENRPSPDTRVVMAATVDFFDRYLRDDGDAIGRMRRAVDGEVGFTLDVVEQ